MSTPIGLRERKKQHTREAIHRAAMQLFAERGFDATTIADIAAAADVAPRTFFSYFATKEEVVFTEFDAVFADLERALLERPADKTALQALRDWIPSAAHKQHDLEHERLEARLIREAPAVAACELQNMHRIERLLAEAIGQDLGEPGDALRPRVVAAAAIAALQATKDSALQVAENDPAAAQAMMENPLATIDETLRFLEGGLAALRT